VDNVDGVADESHERRGSLLEQFFTTLIGRDPSGRSWLPALLAATPNGRDRLGELVDEPGSLDAPLAVTGATGRLACFDYPVAPARELLRWYVDHPDQLTWPPTADLSPQAARLRQALLHDEPPGAQAKAQERARDLIDASGSLHPEWWKFEDATTLDCVLSTHRLVITVLGTRREPLGPATEWYPARSELVRAIESAKQLATDRRWATLLLSEQPLPQGSDEYLERTLPAGAPHLGMTERDEIRAAYLGNLTWDQARDAVGLPG
jgi:hypothetical protein